MTALDAHSEFAAGTIPARADIVVVGGGPAGSTVATLLARKGWHVVQLDKDRHPRFHIGESLLPMNVPIFERLGILAEIERIGVRKHAADFPAANEAGYSAFRFGRALDPSYPHAFHVRRDEFDRLLLDTAAAAGAVVREGAEATAFEHYGAGIRVAVRCEDGSTTHCEARYLVDASGRDTFIGKRLRLKQPNRKHQSAALFAHFSGVERRLGDDEGNISIYRFEHGWGWLIPLPAGLASVGAVCWPDHLRQRRADRADFLMQTLRGIPGLAERLRDARIVGNLHATGNYSYACRAMCGPRWVMVGDAHAFLDPIFSSGVYLAMDAAERAADLVHGSLVEPASERRLQRAYQHRVRHGLRVLSWFIERFTTPAMRKLFAHPRNDWQVEQAMISMLAGDVFRDNGVLWRLRIFKAIYGVTSLGLLPQQWRHAFSKWRAVRAGFAGGTTTQDHA